MSDTVAPEYVRFVAAERRAERLPTLPATVAAGAVAPMVRVPPTQAAELLRVAARRAVGIVRPTARTEVVWVDGDSELAVGFADLQVRFATGLITVGIPVRCDQIGKGLVEVAFAVGAPEAPAGLYASTLRRPNGPPVVVAVWGEALVAFAWQCVLGLVSGLAGATGKDQRGNVLVPAELAVTSSALAVVPIARHRFAGSSGLTTTTKPTTTKPTTTKPTTKPIAEPLPKPPATREPPVAGRTRPPATKPAPATKGSAGKATAKKATAKKATTKQATTKASATTTRRAR
jgi:hypothetical protein